MSHTAPLGGYSELDRIGPIARSIEGDKLFKTRSWTIKRFKEAIYSHYELINW